MIVYLSNRAKAEIEGRAEKNFCGNPYKGSKFHSLYELCSKWLFQDLYDDILELSKIDCSNSKPIWGDTYRIDMDRSSTCAEYQFAIDPDGNTIIYITDLEFKPIRKYTFSGYITLSCNRQHDLEILSEFHSWMKRLNEVKGARPTFWC